MDQTNERQPLINTKRNQKMSLKKSLFHESHQNIVQRHVANKPYKMTTITKHQGKLDVFTASMEIVIYIQCHLFITMTTTHINIPEFPEWRRHV